MESKILKQDTEDDTWTHPGLFQSKTYGHVWLTNKSGDQHTCVKGSSQFKVGVHQAASGDFTPEYFIQLKGKTTIEFQS